MSAKPPSAGSSETPLATAPRPMAPTPQEIQERLGSPTSPSTSGLPQSPSPHSHDRSDPRDQAMARRMSAGKRAQASMSSSTSKPYEETENTPSSSLAPGTGSIIPLSAISEGSDGNISGSDSDSSSIAGGASATTVTAAKSLDSGRTGRDAAARINDSVAQMSSYLLKKGERRRGWKKRWFVLRGGQVAMYKNDKEYQLLRLIPLTEIHACAPIELKKHVFAFGIVTPSRTYYVKASSAAEVTAWCSAVERAKEELKAAGTITSLDTPTTQGGSGEVTPLAIEPPSNTSNLSSSAIPIPPRSTTSPPPSSSPPRNSALSTSSSTSTHTFSNPVPASSVASGTIRQPVNSLELSSLDAGLEKILSSSSEEGGFLREGRSSFSSIGGRQDIHSRERTSGSDGGGNLAVPSTSTSGFRSRGASTVAPLVIEKGGFSREHGPPSPGGIISSSDDEDGFDTAEPWGWTSTGGGLAGSQYNQAGQRIAFIEPESPAGTTERREEAGPAAVASTSGFGDPNKVILAGYLIKQGKRKNWRKRWFVLTSGSLVYSRSHMDTKVHRQIPIAEILDAIEYASPAAPQRSQSGIPFPTPSVTSTSASKSYEHCFKIITPKRTYVVGAPSEEDEIRWLAALQCLVARKTSMASPTAPSHSVSVTPQKKLGASTVGGGGDALPTPSKPEPPPHGRQRSVTDAARGAVREVERRFHPHAANVTAGGST